MRGKGHKYKKKKNNKCLQIKMYNMYLYAMYIHRRRRSKSVMLKYFAPAKYQQVFIFCIACVVVVVVPTDRPTNIF